ncbi:chemotaxis protein MotA [Natronospira proteinivora]|uniref:Chemotaxis protein MotA n=1 Tax=Natronospira proteinivora TaxID=1807133 RepID=A0ABT1G927_9GAMM|nr:flagellar motor protein [Natronospira proteinivora]MCP1726457.1 chemotaxis protein MotA [Natronospira proteinivora]
MDILTVLGIIFGAIAVFGGVIAKGSDIGALWNAAAFIIVIIGTFGAMMLQTPLRALARAGRVFGWLFKPPQEDRQKLIEKIIDWSQVARKEGLLGLEAVVEEEQDEFTKKGLQLLVDGGEPDVIRSILEVDLDATEEFDKQAVKVYENLGIYAPTLGIVGAVMGLMAVMQNLNEPDKLGPGIAAAFVATIYGIGSANLLFLPMAGKLSRAIKDQVQTREMFIDGLISIAEGENPRNIETKLQGYLNG